MRYFRDYLGRNPESVATIDWHAGRDLSIEGIRQLIYNSREAEGIRARDIGTILNAYLNLPGSLVGASTSLSDAIATMHALGCFLTVAETLKAPILLTVNNASYDGNCRALFRDMIERMTGLEGAFVLMR